MRGWLRAPYVLIGAVFDRCYEELPWRGRIPLGRRGEQIARRHLRRRGYQILARNYRAMGAEIDLIAFDRPALVFVEVKTRTDNAAGSAREAVDEHKSNQIRRAAEAYVAGLRLRPIAVRFDVIAITGVGYRHTVELIKDAF